MLGALAYVLYAAIFIAVVCAMEGAWLFLRTLSPRQREVNRRLGLIARRNDPKAALSLVKQRAGGVVSQAIVNRAPWLSEMLWMSRSPLTPVQLICAAVGLSLAFILFANSTQAPMILSVVFGLAFGIGVPFGLLAFLAAKRRGAFLDQFPASVDLVARSLQAGHPVPVALGIVAEQSPDPIGSEFGIAIDEMAFGLDRDEALSNMARRVRLAELQLFVAAIQVTRESGGNLAEVFLKLSDVIRAKATLKKKVSALTAEGRLSCIILALMPIIIFTILNVIRPQFYGEVAADPLFAPMMSAPPIMAAIGVAWIWRMVNFKI